MNCIESMTCVDLEAGKALFTQLTIIFLTAISISSLSIIGLSWKRLKQQNLRDGNHA